MRKGAMVKQKRQRAKRSDRLKYRQTKHVSNEGQVSETVRKGSLLDRDGWIFTGMAEEITDEAHRSAHARRAVERYMEERALKEALADDIY